MKANPKPTTAAQLTDATQAFLAHVTAMAQVITETRELLEAAQTRLAAVLNDNAVGPLTRTAPARVRIVYEAPPPPNRTVATPGKPRKPRTPITAAEFDAVVHACKTPTSSTAIAAGLGLRRGRVQDMLDRLEQAGRVTRMGKRGDLKWRAR